MTISNLWILKPSMMANDGYFAFLGLVGFENHQRWLMMVISHLWISKLSMMANDGYFTFLDLKTINDG